MPQSKDVHINLPLQVLTELKKLAAKNHRTITGEIVVALRESIALKIKQLLFDEIVSRLNQPCEDHAARVRELQELVSTRECPSCHAKQFLMLGEHGECQYCGVALALKKGKPSAR